MRYAIKTIPQDTTWDAMLGVWQAADDVDLFESAWNFDHFYPIFGDSSGPCFEGWTMLAAMATATRRIRLGCQVTGMIYRHPAVLANMAATIDVISSGRLEIGLGAGWNEEETAAYGIDLPPLRERFDRFDEGLDAIVGLLSQETTTLDGTYVRLTDARCEPKPVQQPHPPITIGGNGPKHAARGRPARPAVELDHRGRRRVARDPGSPAAALRRGRAGHRRDHLLGQRAARTGRRRAGDGGAGSGDGGGRRGPRRGHVDAAVRRLGGRADRTGAPQPLTSCWFQG